VTQAHGQYNSFMAGLPVVAHKGASPELSVRSGPPAPLCEIAKSGFDFRVQESHTWSLMQIS
jgi:hypothetical protein